MIKKSVSAPRTRAKKSDENVPEQQKSIIDLASLIRVELKHKNETQKKLTQSIKNSDVTICTGPAGTGKTYLSCLQALTELKNNENIKKIVLVKSVTTLKSEEIGFLKGTMEEKMEPFMYSFTGNFEKLIGKELFTKLKTSNQIEILPIAYLRGVNIDNAIVIIDEVQNITIENIRTILTRLGENSKMIFLGDIKQIDAKNKYDSALSFLLTHFKGIDRIGIVEFSKEDIIRHPLIKVIEDIFDKVEEDKKLEQSKQIKPQPPKSQNIGEVKKEKTSKFKGFLSLFR
jgi:phosphate starvation-inducible PhoH-like protein